MKTYPTNKEIFGKFEEKFVDFIGKGMFQGHVFMKPGADPKEIDYFIASIRSADLKWFLERIDGRRLQVPDGSLSATAWNAALDSLKEEVKLEANH